MTGSSRSRDSLEAKLEGLKDELGRELRRGPKESELREIHARYFGRKGKLREASHTIGKLPAKERPAAGQVIHRIQEEMEGLFAAVSKAAGGAKRRAALEAIRVDRTLPGRRVQAGHIHPIHLVMDEIVGVFMSMGFEVAEGPDVETDYYNFEALNIPKNHPARAMQDTFYLGGDVLLRTQTSPMQIRVMERRRPPLAVIAPGAVYRRDDDVTHSPMFHQIEGFLVDEAVSFGDLKGVVTRLCHHIFGADRAVRFRPSYFPFTEPSGEVDISCNLCAGKGCRVCSYQGWLEILGCGMIHPSVFRAVGYDTERNTGFAFGIGVERVAMLRYGIDDIRLFYENDQRFLNQFG